ncbi:hypothetical protein [Brevibacterium samyangense]|uniref:hypothetical protein n=1 Tax=Brevibacterium samyangense TaxID=366888 RepID=UPI0031DA3613
MNLSDGSTLHSDLVVVCVGHVDDAARRPAEIGSFGAYFPPGYAVDVDYSDIRPDDHVLVRGMGLAAIDSLVLLTLERGGRFLRDVTGRVRYRVSGREPKVFLTSRRGFPNLCKVDGDFRGDDFEPGFFTPERVAELLDRRPLELATDYWPLLTLEAELSYYCELFTGFPSRVRCDWGAFRREFIEAGTRAERDVLIASAVPDSAHHLNITAYLDPLSHVGAGDLRAIDSVIAQTIEAILGQRRNDPSLTSAISRGFGLAGLGDLTHDADTWSDGSRIAEFGRYSSDIKFVLGGPPASRFDELLALREAGIVRFIGARPQLRPTSSGLTVTTVHLTEPIHVDAVIDAWLPTARADRSESSLLRQLGERFGTEVRNGTTTGMIRVSHWTNRVCTGDGGDSGNNVFVVGLPSSSLLTNMIPVKGANSAILRESDAVAHAVLSAAYSSVGHLTHR